MYIKAYILGNLSRELEHQIYYHIMNNTKIQGYIIENAFWFQNVD